MRSYVSAREPRKSLIKRKDFDPGSLCAAREAGEAARLEGRAYLANPFLTDDPRFAAWNDGYLGTDDLAGLDVPPSHKPPQASDDRQTRHRLN